MADWVTALNSFEHLAFRNTREARLPRCQIVPPLLFTPAPGQQSLLASPGNGHPNGPALHTTHHRKFSTHRLQTSRRCDRRLHLAVAQVVQKIQWAGHTARSLAGDMGVDHRRFQALMAEKYLDSPQIDTALDQVRRQMAQFFA